MRGPASARSAFRTPAPGSRLRLRTRSSTCTSARKTEVPASAWRWLSDSCNCTMVELNSQPNQDKVRRSVSFSRRHYHTRASEKPSYPEAAALSRACRACVPGLVQRVLPASPEEAASPAASARSDRSAAEARLGSSAGALQRKDRDASRAKSGTRAVADLPETRPQGATEGGYCSSCAVRAHWAQALGRCPEGRPAEAVSHAFALSTAGSRRSNFRTDDWHSAEYRRCQRKKPQCSTEGVSEAGGRLSISSEVAPGPRSGRRYSLAERADLLSSEALK